MSSSSLTSQSMIARTTRAVIWIVLVGAMIAGAGTAVAGVLSVYSTVRTGTVLTSQSTSVELPAGADSGTATIVSGSLDTATLEVGDLDPLTVGLAAVTNGIGTLAGIAVCLSLAALCWRLLRPRMFSRSLSAMIAAAGATVMIGGLLSQGLGVLVAWMIADQLNAASDGLDGFWPISAPVDPTLIVLGLGLLLVGLAFEYGETVQRESEGLV